PRGRTFTVEARNLSKENKYVQGITLNGKPFPGMKLEHADIMKGGTLVFEMGAAPRK
ncbi:MAG TPA: glycoside hydrolase family 92 protein, partial [Kiritimatiellia bacterium]|nr:glycoside hydrolase family 92 protein [Kiritimatiellia bacterium]